MRYDDPKGDYGRQLRQREVITKLVAKLATTASLKNFTKIADNLSSNVKTNLSFQVLKSILANYSNCTSNASSDYLQGYSAYIDDAAYQIAPTNELQRLSNKIRKELGLKTATVSNRESELNKLNEANGFDFTSGQTQTYKIYSSSTTVNEVKEKKDSKSSSKKTAASSSAAAQSGTGTNAGTYSYSNSNNSISSYDTNPFSSGGY